MLLLAIKTMGVLAIIKDPIADRARGELRRRGHSSGSAIAVRALAVCLAASQAKAGEAAGIPPWEISAPAPHCALKQEREIMKQAHCACAKDAYDLAIHLEGSGSSGYRGKHPNYHRSLEE
jgi:hypothetical protein